MKRESILMLLLIVNGLLYAQTMSDSRLRVGFAGGASYSEFRAERGNTRAKNEVANAYEGMFSPGASVGLWLRLNPYLNFRTGLSYEQKGARLIVPFNFIPRNNGNILTVPEARFEYHYFGIPLGMEVGFGKKLRPFIGLGGYAAYKHTGIIRWEGEPLLGGLLLNIEPREKFQLAWLDLGARGWLGLSLQLKKISIITEASADIGLKPLSSGGSGASYRHTGFSVRSGVVFPVHFSKKTPYNRWNQ